MENNSSPDVDRILLTVEELHPLVSFTITLTCFWIVFSHSTIAVYFVVNRSKQWTNFSKLILSLSLNDLSIGITCLVALIEFSGVFNVPYFVCFVSVYVFFATLCANLYHVFAICVHRAIKLITRPSVAQPPSVRLAVLFNILAWIPAFCLCAIAFAVWGEKRSESQVCKVECIFGYTDRLESAMGVLAAGYAIPILCTNIVYVITCYKLFRFQRTIFPTNSDIQLTTLSQNIAALPNTCSNNFRPGFRAQRRAVFTIGLSLLFLNLFAVPMIVLMSVLYSGQTDVSRDVKVMLCNLFIMNSSASPFVYAVRDRHLGQAMKDSIHKCIPRCFRPIHNRTRVVPGH